MQWKRTLAVVVSACTLTAVTLTVPATGQGRGLSKELRLALKDAQRQVPVFRSGLSMEQKLAAVDKISRQIKAKPAPPAFAESVRFWQSMSPEQQVEALSGGAPTLGAVPAVAAAMVVGAAVGFAVGYALSGEFKTRPMSPRELDAINPDVRLSSFGEFETHDATALDWAVEVSR